MSARVVNSSIMVLISMAICLVLSIVLLYGAESLDSDYMSPIAANCSGQDGCLGGPQPSDPPESSM